MINPKSLENLTPFKSGLTSRWKHSETTVIRVPKCFKRDLLIYAHQLDENHNSTRLDLFESIKEIVNEKIGKVKGYKVNNASQLIKDLKGLMGNTSRIGGKVS